MNGPIVWKSEELAEIAEQADQLVRHLLKYWPIAGQSHPGLPLSLGCVTEGLIPLLGGLRMRFRALPMASSGRNVLIDGAEGLRWEIKDAVEFIREAVEELSTAFGLNLPQGETGPNLNNVIVDPAVIRQLAAAAKDLVARDQTFEIRESPQDLPADYLFGWPAILQALGRNNNKEEKRRIKKLVTGFDGPITTKTQGAAPTANKTKLIKWWNRLEDQWEKLAQSERDRKATLENTYHFGASAEVVPEISGSVKKRRQGST